MSKLANLQRLSHAKKDERARPLWVPEKGLATEIAAWTPKVGQRPVAAKFAATGKTCRAMSHCGFGVPAHANQRAAQIAAQKIGKAAHDLSFPIDISIRKRRLQNEGHSEVVCTACRLFRVQIRTRSAGG